MANAVEEFSGKISLLSKWVASIGLLLMTAIIVVQVFSRYVLNDSPVWAEQAALLLMIWYVFIAAAAGVREGFHIRIAVIAESLPEVLQRWVRAGWVDASAGVCVPGSARGRNARSGRRHPRRGGLIHDV